MATSATVLFQRLRWQLLRNFLSQMLAQSWIRTATIVLCSLLLWGFIFALTMTTFRELKVRWQWELDFKIVEAVFDLMFMILTGLLIFSTGIILFSSLFASPESHFLMSTPIADDHVFAYKFQGAVGFSSWAFVLLGSPVMLAYGLQIEAPWYYYLAMPLFFLGFVLIPGSLGALGCLLVVNLMPRRKGQALAMLGALLAVVAVVWLVLAIRSARLNAPGTRLWFESLLSEFALLRGKMVPFHWVARGLVCAATGQVDEMLYNLVLIWTNGLFMYLVAVWLSTYLMRAGLNRVASGGGFRRRYGGYWLDRVLRRALFFVDEQMQLLIVKDFRTFRRDPAQWAQLLIFAGLTLFYFSSTRRFYEQDIGSRYKNGISLLTLGAASFLMCAYTGRFIFPMLSLEGKKFWILGLLPLDRSKLIMGKFAFSAMGTLIAGEFLAIFSNFMLSMPWIILVVHMITLGLLAAGLSAISVGMGAIFPNFREADPSKIAVGFGGTLNLLGSLLVVILVILLMTVPIHLYYAGRISEPAIHPAEVPLLVWLGFALGLGVAIAAIVVPLRMGIARLEKMEF